MDKMFDRVSIEAFFSPFRYAHTWVFSRGGRARTAVERLGDKLCLVRFWRSWAEISTGSVDFNVAASLAATIGIPSMRIIVDAPCDKFVGCHRLSKITAGLLPRSRLLGEMVLRIL